MKLWPVVTGVAIALTTVACKSPTPPKGVQPITHFEASRYLGKWYEVARLENRFERGLEQVTATYGKRSDGGISVLNRGYDPVKTSGMKVRESVLHRRADHRRAEGVVLRSVLRRV